MLSVILGYGADLLDRLHTQGKLCCWSRKTNCAPILRFSICQATRGQYHCASRGPGFGDTVYPKASEELHRVTIENISDTVVIDDCKLSEIKIKKMTERLEMATRAARLGIWDWDMPKNKWSYRLAAINHRPPRRPLSLITNPVIVARAQSLSYTVLSAVTTREADSLAAKHAGDIDLLITDVVMPEMNGHQLSEHLKGLCPDLKILFMSGYTADVIAHCGVLEEGVCFINKPFSKKDLAVKVREVLDNAYGK